MNTNAKDTAFGDAKLSVGGEPIAHCKHLVWFKMINDDSGDYACMMRQKTSCEKYMEDFSIPCKFREIICKR